jgi:hypothetical protein
MLMKEEEVKHHILSISDEDPEKAWNTLSFLLEKRTNMVKEEKATTGLKNLKQKEK